MPGSALGGRRSEVRCGRDADAGEDDDVDAAVLAAAVGGIVGGDGVEFGIARGGEAARGEVVIDDKSFGELGGARGRELPVGGELRSVDGDVVSVALDAEVVGCGGHGGGDAVKGGAGLLVRRGGA